MNVSSVTPASVATLKTTSDPTAPQLDDQRSSEFREVFDQFVGEVFFGQALKAMRRTVGKPAYFHGGRAEEIFQQQLDQVLAEKLSEASAESFSGPMFELMNLPRP